MTERKILFTYQGFVSEKQCWRFVDADGEFLDLWNDPADLMGHMTVGSTYRLTVGSAPKDA